MGSGGRSFWSQHFGKYINFVKPTLKKKIQNKGGLSWSSVWRPRVQCHLAVKKLLLMKWVLPLLGHVNDLHPIWFLGTNIKRVFSIFLKNSWKITCITYCLCTVHLHWRTKENYYSSVIVENLSLYYLWSTGSTEEQFSTTCFGFKISETRPYSKGK